SGYVLSRLTGAPIPTARTISIEVGMQNSGLGVVLARQNFVDPLVAIPSAISSLCHSLIGSLLAAIWRRKKTEEGRRRPKKTEEGGRRRKETEGGRGARR